MVQSFSSGFFQSLTHEIIASLLLQENQIVQTYGFEDCSIIGSPVTTTKHLEQWGIDEFIIIQKDSSFEHLVQNLQAIISETSTPITVCGGLNSIENCSKLIRSGADRICIQSFLFNDIEGSFQGIYQRHLVVSPLLSNLTLIRSKNN